MTEIDTLITCVAEHEDMICPVCGVTAVDEAGVCDPPSCSHLTFIYVNGEAFEFAEDGMEEWLQEREDLADEDEDQAEYDVWETLKEYVGPSGKIVERIDRDMACGPTALRIWVGFRKPLASS